MKPGIASRPVGRESLQARGPALPEEVRRGMDHDDEGQCDREQEEDRDGRDFQPHAHGTNPIVEPSWTRPIQAKAAIAASENPTRRADRHFDKVITRIRKITGM